MANTLKDGVANIICGLGTYTYTTTVTGILFVSAQCLENPPSSISITLSQTGSITASVTSTAPTVPQENITVQTKFNITAGDIITVAISSAAAIDNQLNTVKTTVTLGRTN
jgi:hypothetical protein